MMLRVGVTGGIGSGKTLVCNVLEKLGIPVYYADREARRLMEEDSELMLQVKGLMGEGSYREGKLDRSYVSGQVFGDPGRLQSLNKLVHPVVRRDFAEWASRHEEVPYVAEEAAILFESGSHRFLDRTILVMASEKVRVARVMERDGVSESRVRVRMGHQMEEEKKRSMADYLLRNSGEEMLLPQILDVHEKLLNS